MAIKSLIRMICMTINQQPMLRDGDGPKRNLLITFKLKSQILSAVYLSVSENQRQEVEVDLSESDESHDRVSVFTTGLAASHHVMLRLY